MATFRFTRLAEADLLSIGVYTLRTWGEAQTIRYIDELEDYCWHLADNPTSGRSCDHIRPGLYRMEADKHVISSGASLRTLWFLAFWHEQMLPERHAFDDEK